MPDMRRNVLPKFIEICMETPCWCPSGWAPTWRLETTETSLTDFCYKSVNLSLEELKNIKTIPLSDTTTTQIAKFPEIRPEISHFLTNSAVMQMPRHAKAYKVKHSLSQNKELIPSKMLHEYQLSVALIHHESNTSGGSIAL